MTKKKLIIISHDALVFDDLIYLKSLPTFKFLLENGARVNTLRSIYPTITYPAHVSIITGVYPNRHGVTNNELTEIGVLSSPWHWFSSSNKSPTLFTAAKKAGLTTAAVFWPVTGNDPDIDYLINEYWSQSKDDDLEDVFRRSGSSEQVMERVVKKNLPLLKGFERKHPEADEFVFSCACDILREFKPDILAIHPAAIDDARHSSGLFSAKVNRSLDYTDLWTGMIIQATKDAGTYEDTNFVIMSDHGQLEIKRTINPNVILRDNGLITADSEGNFLDWKAFCKSAALSAHVYLKDPSSKELYDRTYKLLCNMRDEGIYGISEVFTREEINEKEHLDGSFSFVLESDGYTSFGNDWRRPLIRVLDNSDYRFGRATHGHLPDKGPQPTLIAVGPAFKKNAIVERRPIVDIAPTLAMSLGLHMNNTDGTPITEILQD
ncbi:MAG: alkaline phosphatase family protein [Clostridiaceae bacterium]|jgi:predicted AlkP superfamily pyrophosphatase or phosphodiesterase|nr:alkaline phosphatase family protein [Clostridiaceae bacterium]